MGIFQPGGAGTLIYIYNDGDATGGHTAGQPHTWAEINAFAPLDFAILQTAAGATFSATHRQYLLNVDTQIGHPVGGNSSATSLVDTTGADIFSPNGSATQSRLRFTLSNSALSLSLQLGTKVGSLGKSSGVRGGSIHAGSFALRFICNLSLFGSFIDAGGSIQIQNPSGVTVDIAGTTFEATGSYVIGSVSSANPFTVWNSTFNSTSSAIFCTSCFVTDSSAMIWSAPTPTLFFSSSVQLRRFRRMALNGAVTVGDIRLTAAPGNWEVTDLLWSDTPGFPRVIMLAATVLPGGIEEYRSYDVKVNDENGNSIPGVSVYIETDVDGPILDQVTQPDGNIVFTWPSTGVSNVLPVRDYYDLTGSLDGSTIAVRDRLYTVWVNSFKSGTTPNPNYETRVFKMEWPGRDQTGNGYQPNGGEFNVLLDQITLKWGSPSDVPLYSECLVP